MTGKASRGFMMLSLSHDQIMQVRAKEKSLPEGRLLTPSELSSLCGVKAGLKTDEEILIMEGLENEYHRQEWKRRKLEDLREVKVLSDCEEMWLWDDYAVQNFNFQKQEEY